MPLAAAHALAFFFAAGVARFGWFMANYPERGYKIFLFGQEPAFGKRCVLIWSRTVGWMFTIGGCLGTVLYMVMIPIDLFHSHWPKDLVSWVPHPFRTKSESPQQR
jgi:ABC-type uncharacterized transport system permease subunit